MLRNGRQRGLRTLVLAGYLLACAVSGLSHEHTHSHACSHRHVPSQSRTPPQTAGRHHTCCRGHGHVHRCTPTTAAGTSHAHQAGDPAPGGLPGHCPDECDACRFLAQAPLLVTLIQVDAVTRCQPHDPPVLAALCPAHCASTHLARGPPA